MDFWIFMFIIVLVIPIAMIGIGLLFIYKPPKQINSLYGYRTSMSKKNQETWDFAHQYCGKLWWILGKQLLIFSIMPMIFVYGYEDNIVDTVGGFVIAFQSILMCCSIIPVERALRKNFDKDGHRKETICKDRSTRV